MAISTIGTDALASAAVTSAKLASGAPSRAQLPAGTVLQVVGATTNTEVTVSTGTFVDTTLSATITPTSATSKIAVFISQNGIAKSTANTYLVLNLYRNGTLHAYMDPTAAYTGNTSWNRVGSCSHALLDTPNTTSAVTYKTMIAAGNGSYAAVQINNAESGIVLMEIAA